MKLMKVVLTVCLLVLGGPAWTQSQYPFQNPDLPIDVRIKNILSLMTLDEKIHALSTHPDVPRLGIRGSGHVEGLHGLALGGPGRWGKDQPIPTTQFPQAIGLGETWSPDLIQDAATVEAIEARYVFQSEKYKRGGLVVRAPNADLGRDPRWGRTEESYGEDPFFNGTMVAAFVKGLQGDHPKYWRTASLMKHFLANSNEDGRGGSSSNFDERLLREYYSVPFRMGVEAGSRAYMASYNAMNGVPMTVNPILKDITVKEWGQNGIICTDAGALWNLVTEHHYYDDIDRAAAGAVRAGINQFLDRYEEGVRGALASKLLTEADIDASLQGVYRVMIKLGLLDPPALVPYADIKDGVEPWTTDEHKHLARMVTQKSIVLLKNEKNTLPLDRHFLKSIAVIGARANDVALDWYSGTPPYTVTPLQGIRDKVGSGVDVRYAPNNEDGAAAAIAKTADVAIVVVGNHPTCDAGWNKCPDSNQGKEAMDRKGIELVDEPLVRDVFAANPRTIVVLVSNFPFAINWTQEHMPAIVHVTHNSEEQGNALADVLFGDVNPGGRLTQTWTRRLDDLPDKMDYDIRHGRAYMYFNGEPLYPFGYGLSYTTFAYSNLRAEARADKGSVSVNVDVKNTGGREGDEVVQVYVSYPQSKVERPGRQLVAFQRVTIGAGQTMKVSLSFKANQLSYWDMAKHRFVGEAGEIVVMVGSSSRDIRLKRTARIATVLQE